MISTLSKQGGRRYPQMGSESESHVSALLFGGAAAAISAAIGGTASAGITEADVVSGGKTIVITLTGDTWIPAGAPFNGVRDAIIDGLDSSGIEATGWNTIVRDGLADTAVTRDSPTQVTITLSAFASYNITTNETITVTVPGSALTGTVALTASPIFDVAALLAGNAVRAMHNYHRRRTS